jgi:hypothetical protein
LYFQFFKKNTRLLANHHNNHEDLFLAIFFLKKQKQKKMLQKHTSKNAPTKTRGKEIAASKAARRAHATTPTSYLPNDELIVTYYRRNSE